MREKLGKKLCLLLCLSVAIYVGVRTVYVTLHFRAGRDARSLYYGSRLLLSHLNPYDDDAIVMEWAQDRAPINYKPGLPPEAFVLPPIAAILFAPAAFLPWYSGVPAITFLNYAGLLLCVLLLYRMATHWKIEARFLFACYVLLLPAVRLVFGYGQSTLVICACIAAALYSLSRQKDGWAGLFLELSLAKSP